MIRKPYLRIIAGISIIIIVLGMLLFNRSNTSSATVSLNKPWSEKTERESAAEIATKDISYANWIASDQKEGFIGMDSDKPVDNPIDNIFHVYLKDTLSGSETVWLEYDLKGVDDYTGISRSINDQLSVGGYLVRKNNQWKKQKEIINPADLKPGDNVIRFTTACNSEYGYQVRNLGIRIERKETIIQRRLIVNQPSTEYYYGKLGYIQGYVMGEGSENARVLIDDEPICYRSGSFESMVQKPENAGKTWSVKVRAVFPDGRNLMTEVHFNHPAEWDVQHGFNKGFHFAERKVSTNGSFSIQLADALLQGGPGSVPPNTGLSVTALRDRDVPAMDAGMVNVTSGFYGYRFLPHGTKFRKNITLELGYDTTKIPNGYSVNDIRTFYFNEETHHWVAIPRDTVLLASHTIQSHTDHFTDYINAIIKVPESPETQGYTPTSMKDVKAANPATGINLIAPPSANSMGNANLSYPINIPAGRQGMQPGLAISYNSGGGNGWLGLGWDLSIPSISVETRWGVPHYDPANESETYTMGGEQLSPVSHRGPWVKRDTTIRTKQFYPRVEGSFSKIIRHGKTPKNYWWEVTDKSGVKYYYGGLPDESDGHVVNEAVLRDDDNNTNGNIAYWALTEMRDLNGNFVRHHYVKVNDVGISEGKVPGKQIYIDRITYTGFGDKEGAYKVIFTRDRQLGEPRRPDVTISARYGFKEVTADLLRKIEVQYNDTNIRSYQLFYSSKVFNKTLPDSLLEYDAAGRKFTTHRFTYFDEVYKEGTFTPFENEKQIETPKLVLSGDDVMSWASVNAIGGSKSKAWGLGGYVGVGWDNNVLSKGNSVGVDYDYDKSKNEGLMTMVDINGDGLTERVFVKNGMLKYQCRLPDNPEKFLSREDTIFGIREAFQYTESKTNKFGFSLYPPSAAVTGSMSLTTTETSAYFTDANGDGLIDIVQDGVVYFNRKVNGKLYFDKNSGGTPNPVLNTTSVSSQLDFKTLTDDEVNLLKKKNPLQDAVKMWIAPFNGKISITGPVKLVPNPASVSKFPDGIVVSIQKNTEFLWKDTIDKDNFNGIIPDLDDSIIISKDDKIFFRIHSIDNGYDDVVLWNPEITYLNEDQNLKDPNFRPYYHYNASQDFLLSNNFSLTPPIHGIVNIEGVFKKPHLSDDVEVFILRTKEDMTTDTLWHSSYGWQKDTVQEIPVPNLEVSPKDKISFKVFSSSNVDWNAIEWNPYLYYTESLDTAVNKVVSDSGEYYISTHPVVYHTVYPEVVKMGSVYTIPAVTDTLQVFPGPIKGKSGSFTLSAVKVTGDTLALKKFNLKNGSFGADSMLIFQCVSGTKMNFSFDSISGLNRDDLPDSILIRSSNKSFKEIKHLSLKTFEYNPEISVSAIAGIDTLVKPLVPEELSGSMWFTVKQQDTLLAKKRLVYSSGLDTLSFKTYSGKKIYVEYFLESGDLKPYLKDYAKVEVNGSTDSVKVFENSVLSNPLLYQLGNLYRGWGQFGYNANDGRGNLPVDPSRLSINNSVPDKGKDKDKYKVDKLEGDDMDKLESNFNEKAGYNASTAPFVLMRPDIPLQRWVGYDQSVFITADTLSSSRMGEKEITNGAYVPDPKGGVFAPVKKNKSTTIAASASILGMGGSGSKTNSSMLTDFMDMNGDRFPDIIAGGMIQYTNQRGGLSDLTLPIGDINKSVAITTGMTVGGGIMQLDKQKVSKYSALNLIGNMSAGSSESNSSDEFTYMDINGDGLPDKVYVENDKVYVLLNLGYRFAKPEEWGLSGIQVSTVKSVRGGTGIGGVDVGVEIDPETGEISGGSIQFTYNKKNASFTGGVGLYNSKNSPDLVLMDVNSDGLPDQVTGTGKDVLVRLNRGSSFDIPIPWTGWDKISENVSLNGSLNGAVTFGIPLTPLPIKFVFNPRGNLSRSVSRDERQLTDYNGDGNPDYIVSHNNSGIKFRSSTIGKTNLLKSVTRPLGATIGLDYAQVGNTYEMPQKQWVLSSVSVVDGHISDGVDRMLTTFEYEGGYQDRYERAFYGFSKVVTRQHDTGNKEAVYRSTVQEFANDNYYRKGLLLSETLLDARGKKYVETINTYKLKDAVTMADLPADFEKTGKNIAFPALTETLKNFYEGQSQAQKSTRSAFGYGPYGNVVTFNDYGEPDDAGDDLVASIEYWEIPNDKNNLVSIPKSIVVSNGNKVYRKRATSIDNATGDIIEIRQYPENGSPATFNMHYDLYGNLDSIVRPRNEKGQRMYFGYTYDPEVHSYVTNVRDAYGYSSSATYDYRFGAVLSSTDINKQETRYEIDSLGRITKITGPYELQAGKDYTLRFHYYPGADIPWAHTQHYDPAHPENPIETAIFIDGLGRVLQTKKDGAQFNGKKKEDVEIMIVSGHVDYDAFGRATASYYPVSETIGAIGNFNSEIDKVDPTQVEYDVTDRTTLTILPGGDSTRTDYGFGEDRKNKLQFKTSVTDANGKVSETFTDVKGRQTSVKAPGDTWTSFVYNAISELVEATDPESHTTVSQYDMLGRRISRNHPDAGLTEYSYDLAGNMTAQTTANLRKENKQIRYEYDYSRLTAIRYPLNTFNDVRYEYGKAGDPYNRAGRIVFQEDATGAQEFFYGPLGEIVKNIRTIAVPGDDVYTFTTAWEYDTWNRLTKMTYPDGEELSYTYNTGGLLRSMSGKRLGHRYNYLTQLGYDKFENRVYLSYGNGTETTYDYEQDRRRLSHIVATTSNGRKMMDNTYSYDKVNNILSLVNEAPQVTPNRKGGPFEYTYQYDDLYRLTHAEGDWKGATHEHRYELGMQYSPTGRILHKTQTHDRMSYDEPGTWVPQHKTTYDWEYKYEGAQPHAATHIGENTYTYDANGNQTGWTSDKNNQSRQILWDEENRMRAIADNGVTHHYIYDAAGERVIKSTGDGQAIYINGFPMGGSGTVGNYTMYVNPFMVVQNFKYTKHFYIEGQRIVSKLGEMGIEQPLLLPKSHAGDSTKNPVHWDNKKDLTKDIIIANFEALGLNGAVFTAGKSGKMPYGQIKKYFRGNDVVINPGIPSTTTTGKRIEDLQFYYHPDHLGSSNYITDASGEVYQHQEYFPFGETFVEERNDAEYTTYLFNGKELDEETGLYYYGARYYDPRVSLWYGVDPKVDDYPSISPFCYVANNPLTTIDPDGRDLIYVTVPANAKGTKTQKILVDSKIADKVQKFAYSMNQQFGLVVNSSFRSREKQQELYDSYLKGENPYIVAKPGTSNHEGGFGLDFNVKSIGIQKNSKGTYSKEALDKIDKLNETAKEFGFDYLGKKDAVHFSINPVKGGYYENKGDDIKTNSSYYENNAGMIPTFDPTLKYKKRLGTFKIEQYTAVQDNTRVSIRMLQKLEN